MPDVTTTAETTGQETEHADSNGAAPQPQISIAQSFVSTALQANVSEGQLAQSLLDDAVAVRTSDIHIDPEGDQTIIRFRVHGKLVHAASVPVSVGQHLINQLKVCGKLDPIPTVVPSDARFTYRAHQNLFDVRLTAIACYGGEKLHVRLLKQSGSDFSLEALGMSANQLQILRQWMSKRSGILLVTGPAGTGKTTTLHSVARKMVAAGNNVVTIEDPIEYRLTGATQIQVDDFNGLSFASGTRAALRLDPDCVLIGELRDEESVGAMMTASTSGHTVLSGLHSRNVAEAITVLRRWGARNGPLGSQIDLVINQRLCETLCPSCRNARKTSVSEEEWFQEHGIEAPKQLYEAVGCQHCDHLGVNGRRGVFELWSVTDVDRELIISGADTRRILKNLRSQGHSSLMQEYGAGVFNGELKFSPTL